jgi:hypothetical protein
LLSGAVAERRERVIRIVEHIHPDRRSSSAEHRGRIGKPGLRA